MNKIVKVANRYYFNCPGCQEVHCIDDSWQFNHNYENPTIQPSILVNGNPQYHCPGHSFVKDGKIQFLSDCEHDLKDTIVDLPEYLGEDIDCPEGVIKEYE
jgi:hypothetical protein